MTKKHQPDKVPKAIRSSARDKLVSLESTEGQEIIAERAKLLAMRADQDASEQDQSETYLRFCFSGEDYGIAYRAIQEILYCDNFTSVPLVPEHIVGIINLRSEILAVVDLQALLYGTCSKRENFWVVIVQHHDMRLGFLAETVLENETYVPKALTPALPADNLSKIEYIQGIHQGEVVMLNVEAIMTDSALIVDERVSL
jgi:purine-binding chemotaxis protein CheW